MKGALSCSGKVCWMSVRQKHSVETIGSQFLSVGDIWHLFCRRFGWEELRQFPGCLTIKAAVLGVFRPGQLPKVLSCLVTGVELQVQGSAFNFSCEAFVILVHYLFLGHLWIPGSLNAVVLAPTSNSILLNDLRRSLWALLLLCVVQTTLDVSLLFPLSASLFVTFNSDMNLQEKKKKKSAVNFI